MKKHHLLFFLLLIPAAFQAQVNFITTSFETALNNSSENGKLIFLQFDAAECSKCNEVADKAFANKELSELLQQTFICLRIDVNHPDRKMIQDLYDIKSFGSYFIDQNRTLIHSFRKSTTNFKEYKQQVDIILTKAGEDIRLNQLQKDYASNRNTDLLEMVLEKRKSLGLDTDSLLEEYALMLKPDSTRSIRVIGFIAQMAPVIGTNADNILRRDQGYFNRAWFGLSMQVRLAINNRIIRKSIQKAIREKNEQYAYRVAAFARSTHTNQNSPAATKGLEMNMLSYYKGVNDTVNYLIRAVYYYDNYYMSISLDSIRRRDSLNKQQLLARVIARQPSDDPGKITRTIRYSPMGQFLARDLNEGAWNVYLMTNDPLYLQKALQWSKKAISFWESPELLDTWSRLLYKTGKKSEAMEKAEAAIALQKKQGFPTEHYETVLTRMKKGNGKLED
jgi:thioredoxin-related protein